MARWEPDAQGRLQQAAIELFREHGYGDVTVAQIADRAGLTKRTFFNHFADKREVLFAGAAAFEASVVAHLAAPIDAAPIDAAPIDAAPIDAAPIEAAVRALTGAGLELAQYAEYAQTRRDLVTSSSELQERELIKMASLAAAVAEALGRRGVPARTAVLSAQAALAVFTAAYSDWVDDPGADFATLMQRSLADLRAAVGG